jgi:hypothetical protein
MEDEVVVIEQEDTYELRGFFEGIDSVYYAYLATPSNAVDFVKVDGNGIPSNMRMSLIFYSKLKRHSDLF